MYDHIKFMGGGKFISRGKWKHPERIIDSTEIIILTQGTVYISVDQREYILTPGDVLRLDEGIRHGGTRFSTEDVSFFWMHFTGAKKDELPPAYFQPSSTVQSELICRQLLHYANTEGYPPESADCLMRVLLMELHFENQRASVGNNHTCMHVCTAVREWVRVNCDLPIKASDIAAHFNYNEDYLNRIFKQYHPKGLKAYIDEIKMQKIKNDLINSMLSLQEIASKYAFGDYKYFLKYFKYHEGVSPTKYRQVYCNIHTNNS